MEPSREGAGTADEAKESMTVKNRIHPSAQFLLLVVLGVFNALLSFAFLYVYQQSLQLLAASGLAIAGVLWAVWLQSLLTWLRGSAVG
ncbi:MAG: hypothetical protein V3R89_07060 [Thermoanaerobaculia bacterium]